jgi:hypothetical protein
VGHARAYSVSYFIYFGRLALDIFIAISAVAFKGFMFDYRKTAETS